MKKSSTRVAVGGVFSGICLLLMILTIIPFSTFAMPIMAGAVLVPVLIENGPKTALLVYISVSVLSVFIVPDKEAAVMFLSFFGYYPIIKGKLEKIGNNVLGYIIKLAVYNFSVSSVFYIGYKIFGLEALYDSLGGLSKLASGIIMFASFNLMFVVYDKALSRVMDKYLYWFRPRFIK